MRILHVVLNDFTNDARVLRAARLGIELGAAVDIFCLQGGDLPEREEIDRIEVHRFRLGTRSWSKASAVQLVKYAETFVRMHAAGCERAPAIVHAHDLPALPIGSTLARTTHTALVYDAHELWCDARYAVLSHHVPGTLRLSRAMERHLSRGAASVITVSDGLADRMASTLRIPRPTVVRNMPEFDPSSCLPERPADGRGPLRRSLELDAATPIVLYQGHVREGRGVDTLLRAMDSLAHPHAVLVVLGDGPASARLREQAARSASAKRIRFHAAVPNRALPDYTRDATVGVCPTEAVNFSYRYSLPNKFFEYLQAGLPMVASDLPETTRLLRRYALGDVFPPGDATALAGRLDALLADPERLARHRDAARVAAGELNWGTESARLAAIYASIPGVAFPAARTTQRAVEPVTVEAV